jgi:hypothetical protein
MIGVLLTGLFAFGAWEQMVQAAPATPAADVTGFDLATGRTATIAIDNVLREVVVQRTARPQRTVAPRSRSSTLRSRRRDHASSPVSVTWTNDDGAPHGLEYHDGAKGTDLLLPGASFGVFDRPGTYDYNCSVHPYMTGRVIVRAQ